MASTKTLKGKKNRSGILLTDKVKIIQDLENGLSVQDVMEKYRIKALSTIYNIQKSRDLVPQGSIRKSWNLLYNPEEVEDEDDLPLSVIQKRLTEISAKIMESSVIDEENAEYEVLKDSEIVEKVRNPTADDEMTYNTMDSSLLTTVPESISTPYFNGHFEYNEIFQHVLAASFCLHISE